MYHPTEAEDDQFVSYICLLYHEARNVRHLVKQGVPGARPVPPTLRLLGDQQVRGMGATSADPSRSRREGLDDGVSQLRAALQRPPLMGS
jgi:hypothetical protein